MTLPDLSNPMPKDTIKAGVVLVSPITSIYYKNVKGVIMKYPAYAGAERGWTKAQYVKSFKHMKRATVEEIRRLK